MELVFLLLSISAGVLLYTLVPKRNRKPAEKEKTISVPIHKNISEYVSFFFFAGGTDVFPDENSIRILESWKGIAESVLVRGWTDDFGTPAGNRKLSQQRALEVKRYLETKIGFSSDKILVSFHGTDPESMGNPNKDRFRRVDCLLVQKQEKS